MKRKILIATGIFEPEAGGPATYAPRLAGMLKEAGWDVTVITYSDKEEYEFDREYKFKLIRVVRAGKILSRWRYFLSALKHARDVDFIYTLDWFAAGLPIAIAAKTLQKQYAVRVGGDYAWEQVHCEREASPLTLTEFYKKGAYRRGIYRFIFEVVRYVLSGAEHIIFNSKEERDLYHTYYALKKEYTSVIHNAVPASEFATIARTVSTHEIVFWGRFNGMKNISTLVRAFASAKIPHDYSLALIGDGPKKAEVEALVRSLGIESRVTFMPRMRLHAVLDRIKNSRVFVLPSWTDISPNQVFEAHAIKLPFLVTKENFLPIRDQLPSTVDPRSVEDIAGALEMIADDTKYAEYCEKLGAILYERGWNTVLEEHVAIFARVFGTGSRVLQIGADRSKGGILYPESAAAARQKAYGTCVDRLDIVGFSLRRDGRSQFSLSQNVHVHPTHSITRLLYGLDTLEIVRKMHPDIISVQDPFETGFLGWLIASIKNVPLHVQVHTDFLAPEYAAHGFVNRMRIIIAQFVLHRAARIRVVSERIKISIEKELQPSAPITVLPIYTDLGRFKNAPIDRDLIRRFAAFTKKVLIVSRLESEKNVAMAIRAFAMASPKDSCLIIVGSGTLRAALDRTVRHLKITDRVFFENPHDVAPYYRMSDLVLVPSKYEGYGLVIIEALAAGKPVLSTDVGVAGQAGALVTDREHFAEALREWFVKGPRTGKLADYPYKDFGEYVQAYCDDVRACTAGV